MQLELIFVLVLTACGVNGNGSKLVQQPFGISGRFLTTQVGIGTPPQFFDLAIQLNTDKSVIVDTKSFNVAIDYNYDYVKSIFVPESSDSLELNNQPCRTRYIDPAYAYNTFTADGHYVEDLVTLGDTVLTKSARFCDLDTPRTATYTGSDPLNWLMEIPIDGFFGLSPGGENILTKSKSGISQISFYLDNNSKEVDNTGIITFGGADTKNCKSFRTFPSEDSNSWRLWVTSATFNSKTSIGTYSTLIDLSADRLTVPKDVYNVIVTYFGNSLSNIVCSNYPNPPDLQIVIYGKTYNIPIKSYLVRASSGSSYCTLKVTQSSDDKDDQIILGKAILEKYCLLLDYGESDIGFADKVTSS